jgi:hypothetical protein
MGVCSGPEDREPRVFPWRNSDAFMLLDGAFAEPKEEPEGEPKEAPKGNPAETPESPEKDSSSCSIVTKALPKKKD